MLSLIIGRSRHLRENIKVTTAWLDAIDNVKFPLQEFASRVLCLTASSRATPWISVNLKVRLHWGSSGTGLTAVPLGKTPLFQTCCLFNFACSSKSWLMRNKEHGLLLLTFFTFPNQSWFYGSLSIPSSHLFPVCTALASLVSVCLKSPMILNIDLTFLMPFHVLQYPVGHGQGFYLCFGPFVGWKISVLTPCRTCSVLEVPCGPNFDLCTICSSRIWSNGYVNGDRCLLWHL